MRELAEAADALPAPHAALPRAVRRGAAAGGHRGSGAAARRGLPPADDAHCRAARARWDGARALVTGESVGQVASQTLENMTAIGAATTLRVLRPLVGMDKEEVIADAQRIGTYDISILPDEDCCQLFTPRAPGDARPPSTRSMPRRHHCHSPSSSTWP